MVQEAKVEPDAYLAECHAAEFNLFIIRFVNHKQVHGRAHVSSTATPVITLDSSTSCIQNNLIYIFTFSVASCELGVSLLFPSSGVYSFTASSPWQQMLLPVTLATNVSDDEPRTGQGNLALK